MAKEANRMLEALLGGMAGLNADHAALARRDAAICGIGFLIDGVRVDPARVVVMRPKEIEPTSK